MSIINCFLANNGLTLLLSIAFILSEYLGTNKNLKENSIYQFIYNILKNYFNK